MGKLCFDELLLSCRRVAVALPHRALTGWVAIVWSREDSLINTVHPSDHLESLVFSRGLLLKLGLFWLG